MLSANRVIEPARVVDAINQAFAEKDDKLIETALMICNKNYWRGIDLVVEEIHKLHANEEDALSC